LALDIAWITVFHGRDYEFCRERALVLRAVGIECQLDFRDGFHRLAVPESALQRARAELASYELEASAPPPEVLPVIPPRPGALSGLIGYAATLLVVAGLQTNTAFNVDWLETGRMQAGLVLQGEWWRTVTALTLHADIAHLFGNLLMGSVIGFFAVRLLGPGLAWTTIIVAGAAGNAMNAMIQGAAHNSIGASTAVFAGLGLVSVYSWTKRRHLRDWAKRTAPLVGGALLLAYTGSGGERTDIVAHLTGFVAGSGFGYLYARLASLDPLQRGAGATILALAAGLLVPVCWLTALAFST
jgi:membrane associated rhomboid family serine protease